MHEYGWANRELFVQFLVRIAHEIPNATLAMFSTLKYVNAPNFELFRGKWNAKYLGGFIIHSKAFEGLKGNFPIGFLLWQTNQSIKEKTPIFEITTEVLDKNATAIGEKRFFNIGNEKLLGSWLKRPRANRDEVIPLKNAISSFLPLRSLDFFTSSSLVLRSIAILSHQIKNCHCKYRSYNSNEKILNFHFIKLTFIDKICRNHWFITILPFNFI